MKMYKYIGKCEGIRHMSQWYNKNVGYLYTDGCKNTPILDIFFAKKL